VVVVRCVWVVSTPTVKFVELVTGVDMTGHMSPVRCVYVEQGPDITHVLCITAWISSCGRRCVY